MKKLFTINIFIICIFVFSTYSYAKKPTISAEAGILIDANTGNILFEKNSNKSMYPASTTKIMTAIIALESGDLNEKVVVDKQTPYEIEGSHIALEPGEVLTLNDLIHGMLIESANDCSVVVAKHIGGSVKEFARMMNKKAKEIGAKNTHFTNPNGLPDKNHTTTAYDLAIISRYAMQNETFRQITRKHTYTINPTNKKSKPRYLHSENKLLYGTSSKYKINVDGKIVSIKYTGAEGIKTGYTVAAQQCFVSSVKRDEQRLISVVLNAKGKNIWIDTHKLLNYGFNDFISKRVAFKNEFIKNIEVEYGDKNFATAIVGQDVFLTIDKRNRNNIKKNIILGDKIKAPITKNQVLGKIEYKLDNKVIGIANLVSASEVNRKAIYNVISNSNNKSIFKKWWLWLLIVFTVWRIYIAYRRHKKRKSRKKRLKLNY